MGGYNRKFTVSKLEFKKMSPTCSAKCAKESDRENAIDYLRSTTYWVTTKTSR